MSLLNGFKKLLGEAGQVAQGVERQLNPFDGGATYNNPQPQQKAMVNYARPMPKLPAGLGTQISAKIGQPLPYMTQGGGFTDMRPAYMDKPDWEQQLAQPQPEPINVRDIPGLRKYNFYPEVIMQNNQPNDLAGQLKEQFYPNIRY